MSLAWHTAGLPRAKTFPKLETLLHKTASAPIRRQSWQEQAAIVSAW